MIVYHMCIPSVFSAQPLRLLLLVNLPHVTLLCIIFQMVCIEVALKAGIVIRQLLKILRLLMLHYWLRIANILRSELSSERLLSLAFGILVVSVQEVEFVLHYLLKQLVLGLMGVHATLMHHVSHHFCLILVIFYFCRDRWPLLKDLLVTLGYHKLHEVNGLHKRIDKAGLQHPCNSDFHSLNINSLERLINENSSIV